MALLKMQAKMNCFNMSTPTKSAPPQFPISPIIKWVVIIQAVIITILVAIFVIFSIKGVSFK